MTSDTPKKTVAPPGAPLFGLGRPPAPPPRDETFKRITTNLCAAGLTIVFTAGAAIAVILLVLKLAMWTFT